MFTITITGTTPAELFDKLCEATAAFTPDTTAPQAAAPKPATAKAKDEPKADPTPPTETATASTPEAPKAEGLSAAEFTKLGLAFAAEMKDKGVALKGVMAEFKAADGADIERLSQVQASDYDAFIERMEAIKLAS